MEGETMDSGPSKVWSKIQAISSKIWTLVTDSIIHDYNRHIKYTCMYVCMYV